jgi:hypothetical protein
MGEQQMHMIFGKKYVKIMSRWELNIKTDLTEIGYEDLNCTGLVQNTVK